MQAGNKKPDNIIQKQIQDNSSCQIVTQDFVVRVKFWDDVLNLQLKNFIEGKNYEKILTKDDIGKQINAAVDLQDIYYVFFDSSSSKNGYKITKKQYGQPIYTNNSHSFSIEKVGRIIVTNKFINQRVGNTVYKSIVSNIQLKMASEISQKQVIEHLKVVIQSQTQENYIQKIKKLQAQIQVFKKQKQIKTMTIFIKELNGQTFDLSVSPNDTIQAVKQKINQRNGCKSDQTLVFAGKKLQDDRTLAFYSIQRQSTFHQVLNLRGDIGIFDQYHQSFYKNILINSTSSDQYYQQVTQLINKLKGDNHAKFSAFQSKISHRVLNQLVTFADQRYNSLQKNTISSQFTQDLKIKLTRRQLLEIIGQSSSIQKLQSMFGQYSSIILRRCSAHNKLIDFHIDTSRRTMQLALNDENEYIGGRLVYASQQKLHIPTRTKSTVTIHDNRIVHGVSRLDSGVRYGLFFLLQ